MNEFSKITIGANTYNVKDPTARTNVTNAINLANSAQETADSANNTAVSAEALATTANNTANTTNTKLTNTKIIGTYTSSSETLDISLMIGGN